MNRFFSIFFLFVMSLNVIVPFVERLNGGNIYELAETETNEEGGKEKTETEKEEGKEKEPLSDNEYTHHCGGLGSESGKKLPFAENHHPLSELFASLPELPPEA